MKKIYKIIIFFLVFVFLSTYIPNELHLTKKKESSFFKIKNITITNNNLVNSYEIEEKLINIYDKNIFEIKKEDIESPLKNIYFLDKIEVKKKYPNSLKVKIYETTPVAILFKNKSKFFLDSSSNLIPFKNDIKSDNLPGVFGEEAENYFISFHNTLEKNNFINSNVKNFYYFSIGRWDLELKNNKLIKLPSDNIDNSIKQSIELLKRNDFKKYNIIDLRVGGKIIVE